MKSSFRLVRILPLVMALAACATDRPELGPIPLGTTMRPACDLELPDCNQNRKDLGNPVDCRVRVTIGPDGEISQPTKGMTLHFRRSDQNRFIRWDITDSPEYSFAGDGVYLHANRSREFDGIKWCPDGQKYLMRNRNTQVRKHRYSIRVVNQRTGDQRELDPLIRNLR